MKDTKTGPQLSEKRESKVSAQGDRFILTLSGVVKDTKTGLEWKTGPDRDMTWNEARNWVKSISLDDGGWRMPALDELAGLHKSGAGSRNMTPLLKTTGWWVWSSETKGSSRARLLLFYNGYRDLRYHTFFYNVRAFAVRSRSD
jgi:hypothetical protein